MRKKLQLRFTGVAFLCSTCLAAQVATGAVSDVAGGIALLPPVITKSFFSPTIQAGALSQVGLHFTIHNPNPPDPQAMDPTFNRLTGVGFTDTLPGGLILFTPAGLVASCSGVTAVAGTNQITMSGGAVGASLTCTIDVTVNAPAGTTPGLLHNVTSAVTSFEGGTGNTATSDITVQGVAATPPLFSKQFGGQSIALNGATTLTFTITNTNQTALTGLAFSDTLPAGLTIATPNLLTGSCGGGIITATQATSLISLSAATLLAGQQCQFGVSVIGTAAGIKNNLSGTIASTESGTGGTASATITVVAPPTISKAFAAPTIPPGGTTTLTITITNPAANTVALNGVSFTDNLPAGLTVTSPSGLASTCLGTATATAGSGTVSLTGGTVAIGSSCTVSVSVTGGAAGAQDNMIASASSTNGGTGTASNTATVTVDTIAPPVTIGPVPNIPVLQGWLLAVLGLLLAAGAAVVVRKGHSPSQ